MIRQGDVISHAQMSAIEGATLQRGMNFRLKGGFSVILMSLRPGAPYADKIEDGGRILIYEGHDISKKEGIDPKRVDQPMRYSRGGLTQNGLFYAAAIEYKNGKCESEIVKVYEKIKAGIWVYNGIFKLVDAWQEDDTARKVFKFKLELIDEANPATEVEQQDIGHNRLIPTSVKLEVWKRDKGKCVRCGRTDNLHFDHVIPYSRGGSSLVAENIQILCARHNLLKRDRIE